MGKRDRKSGREGESERHGKIHEEEASARDRVLEIDEDEENKCSSDRKTCDGTNQMGPKAQRQHILIL